MPRILSNNKPRRYADHRVREARRWAESYSNIAGRFPPRDGLARDLTSMAADFYQDYLALREEGKKNSSPVRKVAGIYLATLRVLGGGRTDNGQYPSLDQIKARYVDPERES